jgi:hypothetical protein
MEIRLTPEAEATINQCILDGLCQTPDEAISKALDLLKYQGVLEQKAKLDSVKFNEFAGCLADLDVLMGDSVKIQRTLRDEW